MAGGPPKIGDSDLLCAILTGLPVRVAALDREGRFLLDPDPNPPSATEPSAPPQANMLAIYAHVPGVTEAVRGAFAGDEVHLTREHGGATYTSTFKPWRGPSGQVEAALVVASVLSRDTAMEHAMAELQARARRTFDSPRTGLLYWSDNGTISDANDAFLGMLGYTREDLTAGTLDWRAMTPPEHHVLDDAALAQMRAKGACTPFEKDYFHKDGRRIAVLVGGSTWEVGGNTGVAFVVDLTQRKLLEQQRRVAEVTLQRVVESAPIVLWSVDTEGKFTLSIGRGLRALGLEPGQVLGESAYEMYGAWPQIPAAIRRCLEGEEFSEFLEVAGRTFETILVPLREPGAPVTGLLGISIDVTERRRAEAEQERLRTQLLQVQKLESLGLLAGGIAHDFNNLLAIILGGASTAMLTLPSDSAARADMESVVMAARRAAGLTRQMLAYSGKAHVEIRPIDLGAHVQEIAALLETTVPKKVQLRLDLGAGLPHVLADAAQVQQVVMNLVINGAESIGDRTGTVHVTTGIQVVDERFAPLPIAAEAPAPGTYVYLQVRDTGQGMDEATKSKIFDPFFTTKLTGHGLGLAAVLGIVRAHRGAIEVDSSPGRHTTFKVLFPTAAGRASIEPRRSGLEFRGQGPVLLVDDDEGVRRIARRMLEFFGFTVLEAKDGEEGAEVFARHAREIVLVFVDMTMPKMNGEETLRAIRRVRADVPALLTSGYSEVDIAGRFSSMGFASFLEKPFTPTDLAAALAKALDPEEAVAARRGAG